MNPRFLARLAGVVPFLPGLLAFIAIVGPRAVDPRNLAWLKSGDPATQYLGWLFFRQSEWTFPPGLNPDYGLELASSIVYSDSIPLLAMFFKLFDNWLPQPFQYFGLWLLACFLLQGYFAWKLVGLMSSDIVLRLLASTLLVFSPPMLARLSGHWSLVAHFLILAALYLALRPGGERRRLAWMALLAIATLVHAYFVAMLGLFWLADLAARAWQRRIVMKAALLEVAALAAVVIITAWLAGYFSITSGVAAGSYYGYFRANLLTFIDPGSWSIVLRDLPEGPGDYEGFNYLGLGVMLLAITVLPLIPAVTRDCGKQMARHRHVLIAAASLGAFALSHQLGIGVRTFVLPLPAIFIEMAETFRSSGRMLWPAFYLLTLAIVYVVVRGNSRRVAAVLLALAVLAQVLDTSAAWRHVRGNLMVARQDTLATPPADPFWELAAARYDEIRVLPPGNAPTYWLHIAAFAGTHGMATNAAYLARIDEPSLGNAWTEAMAMIATGNYEADTLYILDASVVEQASATVASNEDMLRQIDGVFVLAPGWLAE
ncbi:MAG TPA: DUF6311 domain-containing protein [Pseudomonadales bacterium]